ncbi:MAG: hypothetical protein AAFR01_11005, partial [Pseudomonadota bacterium]
HFVDCLDRLKNERGHCDFDSELGDVTTGFLGNIAEFDDQKAKADQPEKRHDNGYNLHHRRGRPEGRKRLKVGDAGIGPRGVSSRSVSEPTLALLVFGGISAYSQNGRAEVHLLHAQRR